MPFNSFLYYIDKQEGAVYSHEPQGTLDVHRLIHNLAPWKQSNLKRVYKQKTLILADWTASKWPIDKIEAVQKLVEQLIDNGFTLYMLQNRTIKALNKELINTLSGRQTRIEIAEPVYSEEIKEIAAQQKLSCDNILLIDDYWLDFLLSGQENPPVRTLSLAKIWRAGSHYNKVLAISKQATPNIEQFIIDVDLDNYFSPKLTDIFEQLTHLPHSRQYKKIELFPDTMQSLLLGEYVGKHKETMFDISALKKLKELSVYGRCPGLTLVEFLARLHPKKLSIDYLQLSDPLLAPPNLDGIEELEVRVDASQLPWLLGKAFHLKKLDLDGSKGLAEPIGEHLNLAGLETLNVRDSNLTAKNLQRLLGQSTQLKTLNLLDCHNLTDPMDENLNLAGLEILEVRNSNLTTKNLQRLLGQSTQLKTLNLLDCHNLTDPMDENLNLAGLEILEVRKSNLTTKNLQCLLGQSTQLKTLELSNCKNLTDAMDENPNLASLETLKLRYSNLTTKNLQCLLGQSTQLKTLKLSNCKNLTDAMDDNPNLASLETLYVSDTNLTAKNLQRLLAQSTQLKTLELRHCRNLTDAIRENINLVSLERLYLDGVKLSTHNLQHVLAKAENLKTLIILTNKITGTFYKNVNLAGLKELIASHGPCQPPVLQYIFQQAINLGSLDLTYCSNVPELSSHELNLKKLNTLNLRKSSLNSFDLENILKQAPNLKKLDLSFTKLRNKISNSLVMEKLEHLDLAHSKLESRTLKSLLRACPNLKELNLDECKNIIVDEELGELLTKIKKVSFNKEKRAYSFMPSIPLSSSLNKGVQNSKSKKQPHFLNSSAQADADTQLDLNKKFTLSRLFYPLKPGETAAEVNDYRLSVFNQLERNQNPCSLKEAFVLSNKNSADLIACPVERVDNLLALGQALVSKDQHSVSILGKQVFTLTREWQAVASLFPDEEMSHYQLGSEDAAVEIAYSRRDNLYYLRNANNNSQSVSFDFLLKIKKHSTNPQIPQEITTWINYFSSFDAGKLNLKDINHPNGEDYLNAIIEQKKGACRHRALAFKAVLEKQYPNIPVRIIANDCHAFAEILWDNQWIRCNLGGYPAQLVINESLNPHAKEPVAKTSLLLLSEQRNLELSYYEKLLETWNRKKPRAQTVLSYCNTLSKSENHQKKLVELPSREAVQVLQYSLQAYCQNTGRPFFYINSPDDLICSAPVILCEEGSTKGKLVHGPGGPLYDFLDTHQDPANPPILIVNYDNFDADDIVRFNGLLDEKPHADGTMLPPSALIIGLTNTGKLDYYQGEDFYSRFDRVEQNPLSTEELDTQKQAMALPVLSERPEGKTTLINLFHAPDWQERLLGRWEVKEDGLYFVEGELKKALGTGLAIEIQNGLWDDEKFSSFWQQAFLRGEIKHSGGHIKVPPSLQLVKTEGYDWEALGQQVQCEEGLIPQALLLNPGLLSNFFYNYACDNDKQTLNTLPGFIEEAAGKSLAVNITRSLSPDEWAMLLSACQQHHVQLNIHYEATVAIPEQILQKEPSTGRILPAWEQNLDAKTTVIKSTDIDTTLSQLILNDDNWQVMDVSECEGSNLLIHTQGEVSQQTCQMRFTESKRALLQALEENKKVILKGSFSPSLIDELVPLLLARQDKHSVSGQLVLISKDDVFNYLPTSQHTVQLHEKLAFLNDEHQVLEEKNLINESLSQLKARLGYKKLRPEDPCTDNAWAGMYQLPVRIASQSFDTKRSAEIAASFKEARLNAINATLDIAPYVYITGLTGVGKSTFVEKYIADEKTTLYQGESQLLQWATDASDKRKVLFIDEANLSAKQWSEFEGLFNKPPGILIDGQYYPLTAEHKVIFAGNPVNYGDERQLASFFVQHGNALVFEPMPQEFIYEEILKPVFANSSLAKHSEAICLPFLEIYNFLSARSEQEVLISARELQMMALFLLSSFHQQENFSLEEAVLAAQHYAYQLSANLVPKRHHNAWQNQFKPVRAWQKIPANKPDSDFVITPSREAINQQLDELLQLREYKRNQASNESQRYGGLGGIILEGEPGIGKSELVIAKLLSHGFQEVHASQLKQPHFICPEKPFYRIPVSCSIEQKKALLIQAFHQGAVVIMDEINSSPMMERFLNHLLMGKTAEGERPVNPGFLLIGTQNPVTRAGRRPPSTALERRLITTRIPEYNREEIISILTAKGIPAEKASLLTTAYESNVKKAKTEHLKPAPTFRDLLKLAKQRMKATYNNHSMPAQQDISENLEPHENLLPQSQENIILTPIILEPAVDEAEKNNVNEEVEFEKNSVINQDVEEEFENNDIVFEDKTRAALETASILGCGSIGAGVGALLGTFVFPGVGTALGAIAGLVVGLAAGVTAVGIVRELTHNPIAGGVLATLGTSSLGAAIGGIMGTFVFPGLGTAVGAGIGAASGFVAGAASTLVVGAIAGMNCLLKRSKAKKVNRSELLNNSQNSKGLKSTYDMFRNEGLLDPNESNPSVVALQTASSDNLSNTGEKNKGKPLASQAASSNDLSNTGTKP